jgi:hypothetical protein
MFKFQELIRKHTVSAGVGAAAADDCDGMHTPSIHKLQYGASDRQIHNLMTS